jgi:hypothetical protein
LVCSVSATAGVWGFLINSEIHQYIKDRPALRACQVDIAQIDHPTFLDRDSYADCAGLKDDFALQSIYAQLASEPSRKKGQLTPAERSRVMAAVQNAPTINEVQREQIIAALSSQP